MSFKDKVVIVTGASSGVGAATAIAFTQEGASVVMIGRNQNKLDNVRKKCEAVGKKPLVINADLTDDGELRNIVDKTIEEFNKIDILVNNAAILRCGNLRYDTIRNTYDEVMNTNIRAVVYLTTFATPHLIASKGNIVNISTIGAERVICDEYNAYCVSKAALNHFTRAAAIELGAHGVRVNTVSPAVVKSDMLQNAGFGAGDVGSFKNVMYGPWTESEEIADLILFVASDKARGITGSNLVSDKGNTLI
ncbi:3-oxoacyl-[acyl-carrier-protein] reductase FabG-like [Colias croceus]|uniref:3-oxoacyl-[acyl-carrier-protein] reductase FabG-like n=1 Tax=Colias crocea TaxID=72248 RepID=UPI001E27E7C1|nr:3-oxoacyl-[acyl-carrier-protein] reductase FabG-like [Colias croceus]